MKLLAVDGCGTIMVCDDISATEPEWREATEEEKKQVLESVDITPLLMEDYNHILFDIFENWYA